MRKSVERALFISSAVLVLAGYGALAASGVIGPLLLLPPLALFFISPLAEYLDEKHRSYRTFTSAVTVLFTLLTLATYFVLGLFATVLVLVSFIIVHKYFHRRTSRDYHQLLLMAFFLLLCACARDPEPIIGVFLFVFLLAATTSYMLLHMQSEIAAIPGESIIMLAPIGAPGALYTPARATLGSLRLAYWSIGLSVGCMAVLVLLFILTPRMEAGILQRERTDQAITGISDDLDMRFFGSIEADPTVAMRVQFPEEPEGRYNGPLYWRVAPYHEYAGSRWLRGILRGWVNDGSPKPAFYSTGLRLLERTSSGNLHSTRQQITLEKAPSFGLPALQYPVRLEAHDTFVSWSPDGDYTIQGSGLPETVHYDVWVGGSVPR